MEDSSKNGLTSASGQNAPTRGFWQGLLGAISKNASGYSSGSKFQQLTGLSLDSAVQLRKVQGALRDNWSSAKEVPLQVRQGASKKWVSAQRMTEYTQPQRLPATTKSKKSNAPVRHEEILGLDDIFTAPITGLFEEGVMAQMPVSGVIAELPPSIPAIRPVQEHVTRPQSSVEQAHAVSNPVTNSPDLSPPPPDSRLSQPKRSERLDVRLRAPLQPRSSEPVPRKPEPSVHPKNGLERRAELLQQAPDPLWYMAEPRQPAIETFEERTSDPLPLKQPGADKHLLQAFREKVSRVIASNLPPSGPVKPISALKKAARPLMASAASAKAVVQEKVRTVASPPVEKRVAASANAALSAVNLQNQISEQDAAAYSFVPRFSAEEENQAADWFGMTEGQMAPGYLSQYLRTEKSADIVMAGERRREASLRPRTNRRAPEHGVKRLPIRDQLQLDKELKEDLSGLDYISRNNRIINDSLTNLVEQYFQQAARDEDSSYY